VKSRISGKDATYVAREALKRRPIPLLASEGVEQPPGALVPSEGLEQERKTPPRVRIGKRSRPGRRGSPTYAQN
jgi:hypothetical protein